MRGSFVTAIVTTLLVLAVLTQFGGSYGASLAPDSGRRQVADEHFAARFCTSRYRDQTDVSHCMLSHMHRP